MNALFQRWFRLCGLRIALCIGMCAAVHAPAPAIAQSSSAKARAAYELGVRHYDIGEYETALKHFREAYKEKPDPTFLYNIGQCQRLLGRRQEAIEAYRSYLRRLPETPENATRRDQVQRRVAELQKELDDQVAKTTPPPPADPQPPPPALPPPPAPRAPEVVVQQPPAPEPVEASATPFYKRPLFWGAAGAVVIGAVVTAVVLSSGGGTKPFACPDCSFDKQRIPTR